MALNIKKISNYYKYTRDRGLNVFTFFINGIISKILGQSVAANFFRRYLLGRRDFYDLLLESNGKVLHFGACRAEEAGVYQSAGLGAIFIEANPALLEQASYITLEASTVEIYEGQDLLEDIKKFLAKGYRPLWQPTSPHADLSFKRH